MSISTRSATRALALLAAGGVAAAVALTPVGNANAAVETMYFTQASADADYVGSVSGATCDLTSGDDSVQTTPKSFTSGGTKHASVSINAVFTNSANSSDQVRVKGSYASKLVVKKHKKDLQSATLSGNGKLSVTNSLLGSDCKGSGQALGFTQILFTEHKPGKLVITRDTANGALSVLELVNLKSGKLVALDFYQGDQSHAVSKTNLKPGQYGIVEAANGITVGVGGGIFKQGAAPRATKLKTALDITFTPKKK